MSSPCQKYAMSHNSLDVRRGGGGERCKRLYMVSFTLKSCEAFYRMSVFQSPRRVRTGTCMKEGLGTFVMLVIAVPVNLMPTIPEQKCPAIRHPTRAAPNDDILPSAVQAS